MTATREIDTIFASDDLPLELRRLSTSHQAEETKIGSMLSGVIAARHQDEVICPYMLRLNLVVPAHQGALTRGAWQVR